VGFVQPLSDGCCAAVEQPLPTLLPSGIAVLVIANPTTLEGLDADAAERPREGDRRLGRAWR
jgi:hypothetical protein